MTFIRRGKMALLPWFVLVLQGIVVIASLLGYGIFSSRPELLGQLGPGGVAFYAWAFQGFAVLNMLLGGLAVVLETTQRNRPRVLFLSFGAVYCVSLASELLGTTYGLPFGPYEYTALLGPKWVDKVPLLIPLSWFTMAWPAWILARHKTQGLRAVLVGSALLVAWDLVLDPAMSSITSYWIWGETGAYYGMPWSNLFGWGVTGIVLLGILAKTAPHPSGSAGFALNVYAVNLALPFGFCILHGYWIAVAAGVASGLAALILVVMRRALDAPDPIDSCSPARPSGQIARLAKAGHK
jgi:putative membrane protein